MIDANEVYSCFPRLGVEGYAAFIVAELVDTLAFGIPDLNLIPFGRNDFA